MKKTAAFASFGLIGLGAGFFLLGGRAGNGMVTVPLYVLGSISLVASMAVGFWRRQKRGL